MKVIGVMLASTVVLLAETNLPLMPWPAQVTVSGGRMNIGEGFTVTSSTDLSPRVQRAVARTLRQISSKAGMQLPAPVPAGAALQVSYTKETPQYPALGGDESYTLTVSPSGARLDAPTDLGVLRGLATFVQLVTATPDAGFAVPAVSIQDRPRFPWRGLSYDVSRHWLSADVVKRNLDAMAAVKMNVFHWHLSDDQGFRIESKRYPKLHQLGSDGHYYTQSEIREIIDYAADRGIRVVPEFDMPGHTTSWLVGYPEIATLPGPYKIEREWGIFDPTLDPTKEQTYDMLDGFIGEMTALFPDAYFHIGGDEVNGKQWTAARHVAAFKQAHNLKDNQDLEAYFTTRVEKIVSRHGKRMMGWDEVLHPSIPKNIIVQSWRGQESLAQAAKMGYDGILSNGYYLDLCWPTARHYAMDPLEGATANLTADERRHILGGEAAMWAEYVNPQTVDSRVWPRAAAIAERLWSPQSVKDVDSMYRRMEAVSVDLDHTGVTHRENYPIMLERIAGTGEYGAVKAVADIVEPPKDYKRGTLRKYTQQTPLNHLVDAARPESETARRFGVAVARYLNTHSAQDRDALRAALVAWRDSDGAVQRIAGRTFLMTDVQRASALIAQVAGIGLEALDGTSHNAAWVQSRLATLQQFDEPQGDVLIVIAPHVRKLVEAAGRQ